MLFVMFAIAFPPTLPFMVVAWLVFSGLEIYEEWWCNRYAKEEILLSQSKVYTKPYIV